MNVRLCLLKISTSLSTGGQAKSGGPTPNAKQGRCHPGESPLSANQTMECAGGASVNAKGGRFPTKEHHPYSSANGTFLSKWIAASGVQFLLQPQHDHHLPGLLFNVKYRPPPPRPHLPLICLAVWPYGCCWLLVASKSQAETSFWSSLAQ